MERRGVANRVGQREQGCRDKRAKGPRAGGGRGGKKRETKGGRERERERESNRETNDKESLKLRTHSLPQPVIQLNGIAGKK